MDEWFEDLVKDIFWKGLKDALGNLDSSAASKIETELGKLKAGDKLSDPPLVAVVAAEEGKSVTFLVRGRLNLFGGAIAPFMRLQIKVSIPMRIGCFEEADQVPRVNASSTTSMLCAETLAIH
jgi:hypothetical protein